MMQLENLKPGISLVGIEPTLIAATAQRQQDAHLHEIGRGDEAQPCPPMA